MSVLYTAIVGVRVMVFNATFNNISVLLVEETGVSGENHRPAANHWQTVSHKLCLVHLAWVGFQLATLVVIGTDCKGSSVVNLTTIWSRPQRPLTTYYYCNV